MAIIVTNAVQVARFANALYGIKLGSSTSNAVNDDIQSLGLDATVNAYYNYSFGAKTSAEVADVILGNLGLAGNAAGAAFIEGKLNAAGSAKGAAVLEMLNAFSNLTTDATFGAAATAWNATISTALAYTATNTEDAAASSTAGQTGKMFTLTAGPDMFVPTAGNDTFTALSVDGAGAAASTLTAFDAIDGGAGTDTLNVYTNTTGNLNMALPTLASVKNVEIVNIYNAGTTGGAFGDAKNFVGAAQLWQHGQAVDVENLDATTTAGFKAVGTTAASDLDVTALDTAATMSVALDGVKGKDADADGAVDAGDNTAYLTVRGLALTGLTVTGTLAQAVKSTAAAAAADLTLSVTAGKDVQAVTVSTAVKSTLTVGNNAASTKAVKTVDGSASAGGITYVGGTAVSTIKTGAGNDDATITTTTAKDNAATTAVDETVSALLETGAGDDKLTVAVTGLGTSTVDAGDGKDAVTLKTSSGEKVTINAGAGDDTVTIQLANAAARKLGANDIVNGGDGTDTLVIGGTSFNAGDYAVLAANATNFETIQFAEAATADASKFATYTTLKATADNTVLSKVADAQSVATTKDVSATSDGYVAKNTTLTDDTPVVTATTYAGTLKVAASTAGVALTAKTSALDLTVNAVAATATTATAASDVTLTGDAQTAVVTLNSLAAKTSTAQTTASTADVLAEFALTTTADVSTVAGSAGAFTNMGGLTSLTLKGNGSAVIVNGAKLATVDASGLVGTSLFDGATLHAGLSFTGNNALAETVTLSSGLDAVTTVATYAKMDTITGLNLVATTAVTPTLDTAVSDDITITGYGIGDGADFAKSTTITGANLDVALVNAAASTTDQLVFQYGGDTYIYVDVAGGNEALDAADVVVKLTGAVNLDLLVQALNTNPVV